MTEPERLSLAEWLVLCLVREEPTYGLILVGLLARDGTLGQVWSVPKAVVYRALQRLEVLGLIRTVGEQRTSQGPVRSLYQATPAGDLPAVALALDAALVVRGPGGEREIPAADFFVDYLTSSLEPDEILTAVRVPKLGPGWGYRYEKFHRTAQAWATVGVAALVRRSNGSVAEARIGLTNMGPTPLRATAAESAAAGAEASRDALRAAAASADEGTNPPADLHGAPDYRRHLARVLTGRALAAAAGV